MATASIYNQSRTTRQILKRHRKEPPSIILHLYPSHFRFEKQDGVFLFDSPMKGLLEFIRDQRVPPALLDVFDQAGVKFYDGCIIVEVHDHRPLSNPAGANPQALHSSLFSSASNAASSSTQAQPQQLQQQQQQRPELYRIVLHPSEESLWADLRMINEKEDARWTDKDAMEVEARILNVTAPPLCLTPDFQASRIANLMLCTTTQPSASSSALGKRKSRAFNSVEVEEEAREKQRRDMIMRMMDGKGDRSFQPTWSRISFIQQWRERKARADADGGMQKEGGTDASRDAQAKSTPTPSANGAAVKPGDGEPAAKKGKAEAKKKSAKKGKDDEEPAVAVAPSAEEQGKGKKKGKGKDKDARPAAGSASETAATKPKKQSKKKKDAAAADNASVAGSEGKLEEGGGGGSSAAMARPEDASAQGTVAGKKAAKKPPAKKASTSKTKKADGDSVSAATGGRAGSPETPLSATSGGGGATAGSKTKGAKKGGASGNGTAAGSGSASASGGGGGSTFASPFITSSAPASLPPPQFQPSPAHHVGGQHGQGGGLSLPGRSPAQSGGGGAGMSPSGMAGGGLGLGIGGMGMSGIDSGGGGSSAGQQSGQAGQGNHSDALPVGVGLNGLRLAPQNGWASGGR